MKSVVRRFTTLAAATATAALGSLAVSTSTPAAQFGQQEINQDRVVAIAAPVNNGSAHQLLILEQLSNQRDCWRERPSNTGPTLIDPLLLSFDFTGICARSTDSNGYSVRVGGQDLGVRYRLSIVRRQNDLVLVAVPFGRGGQSLEVGRTNGLTADFAKIQLNPGWRLTKRVYNGQPLGHIYLTHDQNLDTLLAASPASPPSPSTPSRPPTPPDRPASPPSTSVPTLPEPPYVGSRPPTQPTPSPGTPTSGVSYRVIVPASSPAIESRVKLVVPSAFRTTVNGQTVMQAGLFNERSRADELVEQFRRQNLQASILTAAGSVTAPSPSPSNPSTPLYYRVIVPGSSAALEAQVKAIAPGAFRTTIDGQSVIQAGLFSERNRADELIQRLNRQNIQTRLTEYSGPVASPPPQTTPSPNLPQVPNGRVVVMIDPGHGGRDPGAVGIGGIKEKEINLSIARRVAQVLEQQGVVALMTRSDDREIDLDPRVRLAERSNADLFVSIHANSISLSRPDVNGLETYYHQTGSGLARAIHDSVLQNTNMRDRGVRQANFYVIRHTSMPAVLVETGFVTGREDVSRFNNAAERNQLADAIARGVLNYIQRSALASR